MDHTYGVASIKLALIFIALTAAGAANASLLDCTKSLSMSLVTGAECAPVEAAADNGQSYVLKEAIIPAPPIKAGLAGFQVDQTRGASAVPESAPLVVLIGALLAVVLVRAKSCNTK